MNLIVIALVVATIAVAGLRLAPRMGRGRVRFDEAPDRPLAFGSDMAWLAIRSEDTEAVLDMLALGDETAANWSSGLGTVYDRELGQTRIFVSPPVEGWTFVAGLALPHPVGPSFVDKCTPLLQRLAARFPDVHYFAALPVVELYAWVRFSERRLVRAFATIDGEVVWSQGKPTRDEVQLGLRHYELRGVKDRSGDAGGEIVLSPTEEQVFRMAGRWSLDPMTLAGRKAAGPGLGVVGHAPMVWQSERVRRIA